MKTKFILEVGSNHNGDINRCLKFIDKAKELGCYSVKFQLFKINQLFAPQMLKKDKKLKSRVKPDLPISFIPIISKYCKKKNIKFSCTPFYLEAVDVLKKYVDVFKIASYELLWDDLLIKCAKTKKPIILSSGMANFNEVKRAYSILKKNGSKKISILHCVSSYPANIMSCNLNSIDFLRKKLNCEVGWSDHTVDPLVIYSAIEEHSAKIVEFHLDLDKTGWEFKAGKHCWLPKQIEDLIFFIKNKNKVNGKFLKKYSQSEIKERFFRADPSDGLRPLKKIR